MDRKADILVVGGGGRIGATVAARLGTRARIVVRRPVVDPDALVVADYGMLPVIAFDGISRVINCVGISTGSRDLMEQVNVRMPLRLAASARDAGVRHVVHVSSFSVYGGATWIDRTTLPAPTSDYGRTKLAADEALGALPCPGFDVALLRLPLVYSPDALGKLGQLLRLWRRLRILPVPRDDVRRAMISVELAAEVVEQMITRPPTSGVLFAADPQPFTYRDAVRARGERLHGVELPQAVTRAAQRIVPTLADRLFADSQLSEVDNLAARYGLSPRLYRDIADAKL